MTKPAFHFDALLGPNAPAVAAPFAGLPPYNFIGGHNDPTQIPVEGLKAAAQRVLERDGRHLAKYNLGMGPLGYPALRAHVRDKVAKHRGIKTEIGEILITHGSSQSIDFVSTMMLGPGDIVLMEEFSFHGAITKFRKAGAELVGMAMDNEGIDVEALAAQLAAMKAQGRTPKMLFTIPTVQNPTGTILPLARREKLVALAQQYGFLIFEDECYADLVWDGIEAPPALYTLDPEIVIHIGSFSKSLAPALRLGYVIASWPVLGRMLSLKTDAGTGALDQMIAAEYFSSSFEQHVAKLAPSLKVKLDVMVEAMAREFGAAAEMFVPPGGIFLWIRLPQGVDTRKLVAPAAKAGLVFNPGPDWAIDAEAGARCLRLCFALPTADEIRAGVAELARICFEETGIPTHSGNIARQAMA